MEREKTIKNIGEYSSPTSRLLLFGGVYSNLQALEVMIQIADSQGIRNNNIMCTGDVVGYCAQPEEVVQAVKNWGIHSIAGNVEIQLREGEEDCGCDFRDGSRCDVFSRQWYPFAQQNLSADSINWMHELPDFIEFQFGEKKCVVVHGSYFETSGYVFESADWAIKMKNFEATQADVIIAGHCGLPFSQKNKNKYWLNPGVIGMPANDGTTRVWYMILETNELGEIKYTHHSLEYDNQQAADLMFEKKLPSEYAQTLLTGLWENCEILPAQETSFQGVPIDFNLQKT